MRKNLKAITLIETLIYMTLLGILITVVMQFALSTSEYNRNAESRILLQQSVIFVDTHLKQSFLTNNSVVRASSTFNSDNGKLVLSNATGNIEYFISNNQLVYKNSTGTFQISPSEFIVNKFYVEPVEYTVNQTVGVKLTVRMVDIKQSANNNTFESSYTFE